MDLQTIKWQNNAIRIIDQTKLPSKLEYVYIKDLKALWQAIKMLKVRGAPALGAAAALGVYLGIQGSKAKDFTAFKNELDKIVNYIGSSRPTARNLFWALERIRRVVLENEDKPISLIKRLSFKEAQKIIEEDKATCRRMGYYGAGLIDNNDTILTICNAGILATIDYGTALGAVYRAKEEGKDIKVYVCETRPLLQGARLTAWELKKKGIKPILICDNMAATLMGQERVDSVFVGADRIARNGDAANKIGTYNLAVLAKFHRIPFYVVAPLSTFDLRINNGREIPIEQRDKREVTELFFKRPIAPKGVEVINPAFDITPHELISAIVTERGIINPPYKINIKKVLANSKTQIT